MLPYFTERFGNPSSAHHAPGRAAARTIDEARERVDALVGCEPEQVFFTSGATESDNLAILGVARGLGEKRRRVVTTAVEHKAVLAAVQSLSRDGFEVVVLPVDRSGCVRVDEARAAMDERTLLVSVQAANNEVGALQPIAALAALAHEAGALFHCDATQLIGKLPLSMHETGIDLLSLSAHKFYGPKGIGALCLGRSGLAKRMRPLVFGGDQEGGLRSGTQNVPAIVGLGAACAIAAAEMDAEAARLRSLRDYFEATMLSGFEGARVNGAGASRLPGASNILLPGIEADALLANLPELALSTTSACVSGTQEPSHVLLAMGLTREEAYQCIRMSPGRFTTPADIEVASARLVEVAAELRAV